MLLVVFLLPQLAFVVEVKNKARSKDDENDLNEPVTDVASENCEMEQNANVLNEELDRHVEQEQKPIQIVMLVQIEREKLKSGLYVEYTAEMKFRVNEESVQMYKPKLKKIVNVADAGMNAVQSFTMKTDFLLAGCAPCPRSLSRLTTGSELSGLYPVLPSLVSELLLTSDDMNPGTLVRTAYKSERLGIGVAYLFPCHRATSPSVFMKQSVEADELTTSDFLLRKSMKTLFTLFSFAFLAVIVQGGEESGKKVEPLPCKDRGSKASCNRYMKKDNFEELCKENRRIGRYLCCKTCAEKLGVEVNEDGKFKDFGTFTYYEPTCPALEDRGNHTICEMIKHGSEVYKCDQSEAQAACAKTCNLRVIIISTAANSAAAWVVHTIPGFPTAKTPYNWPASETARGHLLICLTVSKSQINAISASLLLVQPVIHYNDIPKTETAGMPYFKKLAEGQTPIIPPFRSRHTIRTQNAGAPVTVHIYSKSESSKYEIYKKVIVKALKKTIKVWSRRDKKLKGDCRVPERYIRLLQSPGVINGHNTNLEADDTNWTVSDPGSVICHVKKPYFKNQSKEPAMAICIENNDIFTRFNEIAAQVENCP
ncbi:Deoxyribonuclease-2-beta, partial [Trichinella sp. T9]